MEKSQEPLLNIKEVAESFRLSVPFLRKALSKYGIPHYKIGRLVKFKSSEVSEWIEQRRRAS